MNANLAAILYLISAEFLRALDKHLAMRFIGKAGIDDDSAAVPQLVDGSI